MGEAARTHAEGFTWQKSFEAFRSLHHRVEAAQEVA